MGAEFVMRRVAQQMENAQQAAAGPAGPGFPRARAHSCRAWFVRLKSAGRRMDDAWFRLTFCIRLRIGWSMRSTQFRTCPLVDEHWNRFAKAW